MVEVTIEMCPTMVSEGLWNAFGEEPTESDVQEFIELYKDSIINGAWRDIDNGGLEGGDCVAAEKEAIKDWAKRKGLTLLS